MGFNDTQQFSQLPNYLTPVIGMNGILGLAGGIALRDSLFRGSPDGVMDLLESMDARGAASALRDAGFAIPASEIQRGRGAVLESVKLDLDAALNLRVDGFGLNSARTPAQMASPTKRSFAAKAPGHDVELEFAPDHFLGDIEAARVIQGVLRSDDGPTEVSLLGDAQPSARSALLLVAGQALKKEIQGFGFEGIPGKYQVSLSMGELLDLHTVAAQTVAVESARRGVASWESGEKASNLSEWVPDSVQRLLHGSVSLAATEAIVQAIEGGGIARHAGEIGSHGFTGLLAKQGFDVNAATVDQQAEKFGWSMKIPDRTRGQYFGQVVAVDHRACLIKVNRENVVALPFVELAEGQSRPQMGDSVRMSFKGGELTVSMAERVQRDGAGAAR